MSRKHLLLVEDDMDFRQSVAEMLSEEGFEVAEASDGIQSIRMLDRLSQIDLLVTDIQIPGCFDGNDVAVRARVRHPGLPVVYMSGCPESLTNRIGARDAFIGKPFRSSLLLSEVRRLLRLAETLV